MGKIDDIHAPLFDEVHARGNRLESEAALAAFVERLGIDREAFLAAYRSAAVSAKVEQAGARAGLRNRFHAVAGHRRAVPNIARDGWLVRDDVRGRRRARELGARG